MPSNAALLKKIIEQKCFGISHIYLEEKAHTAIANTAIANTAIANTAIANTAIANTAMALAELVKYNSSK